MILRASEPSDAEIIAELGAVSLERTAADILSNF
jgi:hypothetical protein